MSSTKACRTREKLAELIPRVAASSVSYAFSPHTLGKLLNNNIIDKIVCIFLHCVQSNMKKLCLCPLWFRIG